VCGRKYPPAAASRQANQRNTAGDVFPLTFDPGRGGVRPAENGDPGRYDRVAANGDAIEGIFSPRRFCGID
jgi:hypothetical protein